MSLHDLSILDIEANVGYLDEQLPNFRDAQIAALVRNTAERAGLAELEGEVDRAQVPVLLVFAERMASLAVRRRDAASLADGLRAAALATAGDKRDAMMALALLWDAAGRIGVGPGDTFRSVAGDLPRGGPALERFAQRDPEDQTIEAMGYRTTDEDGFRYERTW